MRPRTRSAVSGSHCWLLRARTRHRTASPPRTSASTRWPPTNPVAPVTSARHPRVVVIAPAGFARHSHRGGAALGRRGRGANGSVVEPIGFVGRPAGPLDGTAHERVVLQHPGGLALAIASLAAILE